VRAASIGDGATKTALNVAVAPACLAAAAPASAHLRSGMVPIGLAILPGTVMRLLAVTAIGAGAAAAALGATLFGEIAAGLGAADRASS
jgi:hypothetical protein